MNGLAGSCASPLTLSKPHHSCSRQVKRVEQKVSSALRMLFGSLTRLFQISAFAETERRDGTSPRMQYRTYHSYPS